MDSYNDEPNNQMDMRGPRIPVELLYTIIDLFRDNRQMLKTLALVSRGCTRTAQSHMFSDIKLNSPTLSQFRRGYPCTIFNDILRTSPHLASYVQRLSIIDGYHTIYGRVIPNGKHPTCRYAWVAQERALIEVLSRVVNLECLKIEGSQSRLSWWSVLTEIRAKLLAIVAKPHFFRLELINTRDFLPLLESAAGINSLGLLSFFHSRTTPGLAPQTGTRGIHKLRSLDIQVNLDFMQWVNPSLDLSALQTLVVRDSSSGNNVNMRRLLNSTSRTLEHLQLQFKKSNPFNSATPLVFLTDLSQFLHLRSLSINLLWRDVTNEYLTWLVRLLYTIPDTTCIETIEIQLPQCDSDDLSPPEEYVRLDEALLHLALHTLRSVRAKVTVTLTEQNSPDGSPLLSRSPPSLAAEFALMEKLSAYHACLPLVSANGLLQIEPDEEWDAERNRVCDTQCDRSAAMRF